MSAVGRLVGGAAVAGIAIFGGVTATGDDTERNESGEITEAGGLGVFAMQDGDCFIIPEEDLVQSVEAVPCTDPHNGQQYADVRVSFDGVYDEEAVYQAAIEACWEPFEAFVGTDYDSAFDAGLNFQAFYPTEEGWEADDQEASCYLVPTAGMISYDAQGYLG